MTLSCKNMWGEEMLWMKTQRKYSGNIGQIYTCQYETKIWIENILHLEPFVLSLPRLSYTVKRLFSLKLQSTRVNWRCSLFQTCFPGGSMNSPANAGDTRDVGSTAVLGGSLEEEMAAHSSILAWKVPWTEGPGRLQTIGSQKSWTQLSTHTRCKTRLSQMC